MTEKESESSKIDNSCYFCKKCNSFLELCIGNLPYTLDYYICSKCDSTYLKEDVNDNNTIETCQNDQKPFISSYNFITMENGRQNDENNAT